MSEEFFKHPILNSPYAYPAKHWQLEHGRPTQTIASQRRRAEFITAVPRPQKQHAATADVFDQDPAADSQKYNPIPIINELRQHVDAWRNLSNERDWRVTPYTARLLKHWRHYRFSGIRPFFCQIEAAEVAIWLTEVAPQTTRGKQFLDHLAEVNSAANPGLNRLALKLATGAGKTTVMAMLIAWQTINAVRQPQSKKFTRGFLIVTPGLTIRDRLRVLQPHDPDSYYTNRALVPQDLLPDLKKTKLVITNYHTFKRRERVDISKAGRTLLQGHAPHDKTPREETDGQLLQRALGGLMNIKNLMVINDEAHHCYREKPGSDEEGDLKGDDRKEADNNQAAARLWISGLETIARHNGLNRIIDLSATPFFLRGSGYAEGTLFPWTMSDFSLMDAIECGIVKLPRVPVSDNVSSAETPILRELWQHIGAQMPKTGRKGSTLDPLSIPTKLQTALAALYGHYEKTFHAWQQADIDVPPCFIVVCNNTATSKLVYDYIAGFAREHADGTSTIELGRLPLFSNYDEHHAPLAYPRTLLIDSEQLEAKDSLDKNFRTIAAEQIDRFRREIIDRHGDPKQAANLTDQDLLREVMNTIGQHGTLGGKIRCVVSVSMLTEGWDANTVTHVLGVRAFGTQLLCEQVVGRALRRQSYELNEAGRFNVEYADVIGVPFDFTAQPVDVVPVPPRQTIHVKAVCPARDALEIRFPRINGYRVDLPDTQLSAKFTDDSHLVLTPDLVGPTITRNEGIIGEATELDLGHTRATRHSTVAYELASHLVETWRDADDHPQSNLFGELKRIANRWLQQCLTCKGDTYPAQLLYPELTNLAGERINAAITRTELDQGRSIKALLDPYNPTGSTRHVNFTTSKPKRWQTAADKSHINYVILDSDWEAEFCRAAEAHPRVQAYVKNHSLGLEVPYRYQATTRRYYPDFILQVDTGQPTPLHLVIEIKGYRNDAAKQKKLTMETYWIPAVNKLGHYGHWAFAEFTDVLEIQPDLARKIAEQLDSIVRSVVSG